MKTHLSEPDRCLYFHLDLPCYSWVGPTRHHSGSDPGHYIPEENIITAKSDFSLGPVIELSEENVFFFLFYPFAIAGGLSSTIKGGQKSSGIYTLKIKAGLKEKLTNLIQAFTLAAVK